MGRQAQAAKMVAIRIIDVEKVIQRRPILRAVNLDVPDRAISVLVGPTGSGKTTLLRIVAGLDSADTGRVLWDDRDVTSWPAHRRRVGMAFQSAPVFPSRSVRWNLSFPLRFSRPAVKALRQEERVEEVARLLDLGDDLDRTAGSLSGGEQRRVSLGRALVAASDVLLLDEPLAHLDAASRRRFQTAFRSWQRRRGITCLYVTHDGEEALAAADHVAVM
ncbi:MAG TPA: ATP-binding cassette domain-containing protein, partial [Bryobacterales bacterium]|nr:ATP-binding cassette domain-containing protein [Bryobacterales bacterium]